MFSIVAVEVGIKRPGYVFLCEVSSPLLAAKKFTPSVHNPRINSLVKKARRTLRREPQGGMHHWSKACRPLAATTNTTKPMMCRPTNLIAGYRKKKKNSSRKSNPHDTWKWCYLFHSLLNWSKKSTAFTATSLKSKCLAINSTTQSHALKAHAWTWLFTVSGTLYSC